MPTDCSVPNKTPALKQGTFHFSLADYPAMQKAIDDVAEEAAKNPRYIDLTPRELDPRQARDVVNKLLMAVAREANEAEKTVTITSNPTVFKTVKYGEEIRPQFTITPGETSNEVTLVCFAADAISGIPTYTYYNVIDLGLFQNRHFLNVSAQQMNLEAIAQAFKAATA